MQWSPIWEAVEALQRVRGWIPSRTVAHVGAIRGRKVRIKTHVIIVRLRSQWNNLARVAADGNSACSVGSGWKPCAAEAAITAYRSITATARMPMCFDMRSKCQSAGDRLSDPFGSKNGESRKGLNAKLHCGADAIFAGVGRTASAGRRRRECRRNSKPRSKFCVGVRTYGLPQNSRRAKAEQIRQERYACCSAVKCRNWRITSVAGH